MALVLISHDERTDSSYLYGQSGVDLINSWHVDILSTWKKIQIEENEQSTSVVEYDHVSCALAMIYLDVVRATLSSSYARNGVEATASWQSTSREVHKHQVCDRLGTEFLAAGLLPH